MIITTGATGQLGRSVVKSLLGRVAAEQIGVSVRDVEKATDLAALGVRVRSGDFANPGSLGHAFEGVTQLLLVSSNASSYGGDALAQHRSAIDAAIAAGATRIVYTSHMGVSDTSAFPPMRDHFATETMLRQSGLAWTSLRNGFYATSGIALMGDALQTGTLSAGKDGKVSWTAHADLAEAAAIVLADPGRFEGPTPPLTGSEALDLADLALIASELTGKTIVRTILTNNDMMARMAERGMPERAARVGLGLFAASHNCEFSLVDPTLEQLIGHKPITMRDLLTQKVAQ